MMDNRTVSPGLLALLLIPSMVRAWSFWHAYPGDLFAPNHQLVVMDYLNVWAGGRLAAEGRIGVIFDPHAFPSWLWSVFGDRLDLHGWAYPPHMLFLAVPFAWMPLVPGFFVWTFATGAVLWFVLRHAGGLPASYAFAAVLSPAGFENALIGQNAALITAALAGGLLLSERRPVAAGALLAVLTLKPQFGLLVPVCLLARRDWRTMAATALFSVGYCAAGLAVFGWDAWKTYVTVTAPFTGIYLDAPFGIAAHFMMVPPFITMRAAGADLNLAYGVQAVASVLCLSLAYWAWSRRHADRRTAVAFVLCLAPLTTPYAHSYDLVCVAAACAILAKAAQEKGGLHVSERLLLVPAWVWPGSAFGIGTVLCPGLGAICVGLAAFLAGRSLWRNTNGGASNTASTSFSAPAIAAGNYLCAGDHPIRRPIFLPAASAMLPRRPRT